MIDFRQVSQYDTLSKPNIYEQACYMIHQIVSHRFIVLCLSILAAIPFLIQLPDVKTVDNVDYFTIENDPDVLFYDRMKEIFGNDEFFIIAFQKDNLFTRKNLQLLKTLTDD